MQEAVIKDLSTFVQVKIISRKLHVGQVHFNIADFGYSDDDTPSFEGEKLGYCRFFIKPSDTTKVKEICGLFGGNDSKNVGIFSGIHSEENVDILKELEDRLGYRPLTLAENANGLERDVLDLVSAYKVLLCNLNDPTLEQAVKSTNIGRYLGESWNPYGEGLRQILLQLRKASKDRDLTPPLQSDLCLRLENDADKLILHENLALTFPKTLLEWEPSDSWGLEYNTTAFGKIKNAARHSGVFWLNPDIHGINMNVLINGSSVYGCKFKAGLLGTNVVNKFLAQVGLEYAANTK